MKNNIFIKIPILLLAFLIIIILLDFNVFYNDNNDNDDNNEDVILETTNLEITKETFETIIVYIPQEISIYEKSIEETISKEDEMNLKILEIDSTLTKEKWFIEYKKIIEEYRDYSDINFPETIYDIYTENEISIMLSCIETEVFTGDFESKCNVASVIFNRVYNKKFPNNPVDVITAPYQFAHGRQKITESTRLALEYVYIFGDTTNGCVAFRSDKKPEVWRNWKYQFTDNVGHNFYK